MRRAPTRDRILVPIMVSDAPMNISVFNDTLNFLFSFSICNWSEFHGFPFTKPSQWQLYRFVER